MSFDLSLSSPNAPVKPALGGPPPAGAVVLAAVSGGADSTALARLLAQEAGARGWRVVLGHVDHGLRPDSAADAAFVERLAAGLGLAFLARRVGVAADGLSPEDAARRARRAALLELAAEAGAGVIALAHTADDQAETLLGRLLTGSGPTGLAGMRPADGPWWRPLLGVRRAALRQWLASQGAAWREDPSNQGHGPLRNRVRARLLPLAEAMVNPRAVEALTRLAGLAADEEAAWDAWCAGVFAAHGRTEADSLVLAEAAFAAAGPAARRRLTRWLAGTLTGRGQHLLAEHAEQAVELMGGPPGRARTLPGGLMAWREHGSFRLGRAAAPADWSVTLPAPGVLALPHIAQCLVVERAAGSAGRAARGPTAWLPAAAVRWPLILRPPAPGERFRALGAPGAKRLSRWFIDARVPAWWRARSVVVADAGGIWWVAPWSVAERARATGYDGDFWRVSLVDTPAPPPYTKV